MELVEELDAIKRAERRAGLAQQAAEPKFFTEGSGGNESEEKTGKRQPQRAQRSQRGRAGRAAPKNDLNTDLTGVKRENGEADLPRWPQGDRDIAVG